MKPAAVPRLLAIGGHVRSGTTMLRGVCNSHPHILLTQELRVFLRVGAPPAAYVRGLRGNYRRGAYLKRTRRARHGPWARRRILVERRIFLLRLRLLVRLRVLWRRKKVVDLDTVEWALRRSLPKALIIGDKEPQYARHIGALVRHKGLLRVMIYRDVRDVAQSVFKLMRGPWMDKPWYRDWDARTIATNWVHMIGEVEAHRDQLHVIRYEELVSDPEPVLHALGTYLGVDPAGFDRTLISDRSVGKWRTSLTPQQVADIMEVAGPTLIRLGYPAE